MNIVQLTLENSNTQFLELFDSSNKFSILWTLRTSLVKKNSRYLEYLGRSNRIVEPLDDFLSFSRTFVLIFRPKFESSKVRTFYSIFWLEKHITKVFSFLSDVYLRKMAPVKRKLTNRFLAEKCKALKDLENGLLRYKNSLYGRFYIELTKSISYGNNPFIFIVLSPFLENLNSR